MTKKLPSPKRATFLGSSSAISATLKPLDGPAITAWSFSRWETYVSCPAKAKFKYIQKLPEPDSPAAARGTAIHKIAEDYLVGAVKKFPTELSSLKDSYLNMRKAKPEVEKELAYDRDWKPVTWFAKNAYVRIKIDALVAPRIGDDVPTAEVHDHKTGGVDKNGKLKENKIEQYDPQMELYGIAGLLHYPTADVVKTQLHFIDAGKSSDPKMFDRKQLPDLIATWEKRVRPMLNDRLFVTRPGVHCNWCTYSKHKGGPCTY